MAFKNIPLHKAGEVQCSLVQSIKQHSYVGCEMGPCVIVHSCQASWMTLNVNIIVVRLEKKSSFFFFFTKNVIDTKSVKETISVKTVYSVFFDSVGKTSHATHWADFFSAVSNTANISIPSSLTVELQKFSQLVQKSPKPPAQFSAMFFQFTSSNRSNSSAVFRHPT